MMHDEVIIPYDRSNKKYIYFYGSTTNIMSYGTLNKLHYLALAMADYKSKSTNV